MKLQIDKIVQINDLNQKKEKLARLLNINFTKIEWQKKGTDYIANYNDTVFYSESNQHVIAASKLMRIPIELWFMWASVVRLYGGTNSIVDIPLNRKLQIFKKAFHTIIEPYYEEEKINHIPKVTSCFNCRKKDYLESFSRIYNGKKYWVYICSNCGMGIRFPKGEKEDLEGIYRHNDYFTGKTTQRGYFDYDKEASWRIKKGKDYLQKLEKVINIDPKTSFVLDLGSGYGYFLKALDDNGYLNLGIELSPEAVDIAVRKYKTKTICGTIVRLYREGKVHDCQFDLITLWDVIEHFYDFNEELEILSRILKPGGYIALRTNNLQSIEFEVFGKFFHSIKDEHTFYFSPNTLCEIFAKYQIQEYKTWTHTHMFLAYMSKSERDSIDALCKGGDIFYIGKKKHEKN